MERLAQDFQGHYPKWGPPFIKSKTWAGFNDCLNRRRNFTPWLSPLFELTKTKRGLAQDGGHVAFQKPVNIVRKNEINKCSNMNNTKRNHGKEEERDEGQKEYILSCIMNMLNWVLVLQGKDNCTRLTSSFIFVSDIFSA